MSAPLAGRAPRGSETDALPPLGLREAAGRRQTATLMQKPPLRYRPAKQRRGRHAETETAARLHLSHLKEAPRSCMHRSEPMLPS
jgi:hypothetical protein